MFLHHSYIALRSRSKVLSRSKVRIKVMGQGQRSRSNFWRAAVNIRGAALPSAAISNNHHYQSKLIVCVSVISGRLWIITWMRSIGFYLCHVLKANRPCSASYLLTSHKYQWPPFAPNFGEPHDRCMDTIKCIISLL